MKTSAIKFAAFAMMFAITIGATAANKGTDAGIALGANETVEVYINHATAQMLTLNVYNATGTKVYEQTVTTGNGMKISHDASGFPEGFYTYEVVNGEQVVYSAKILKSDNGSMECRTAESSALASISCPATDLVLVRLVNSRDTKSRIRVTDDKGRVLFTKSVKNDGNYKINCDINEFPAGDYTFSVYSQNELIAYRKISK